MTDSILFKEIETDFVYEVQLLEDYVLVRPASPDFAGQLEKLTYGQFGDRFAEFWGHPDEALAITVSITRH